MVRNRACDLVSLTTYVTVYWRNNKFTDPWGANLVAHAACTNSLLLKSSLFEYTAYGRRKVPPTNKHSVIGVFLVTLRIPEIVRGDIGESLAFNEKRHKLHVLEIVND